MDTKQFADNQRTLGRLLTAAALILLALAILALTGAALTNILFLTLISLSLTAAGGHSALQRILCLVQPTQQQKGSMT